MRRTTVLPLIALTALAACMLAGCGAGPSDSREGAAPSAAESGMQSQPPPEREAELQDRELELARREAEVDRREREATPSNPQASAKPAPAPTLAPADAEPVTTARPPVRHYPRPAAEPAMQTVRVTVPAATALNVEFLDPLSSETAQAGDPVRARLVDGVTTDGHQVFPAGSMLTGTVTAAVPTKKIGGQASVSLAFDRIDLPSGESVALRATLIQESKSQTGKDAATIGGAAAGGALLGRVLKHGDDKGKATAIGAVVGAAVGTAVAAKNKAEPVNVEPGMTASLELEGPVSVAVRVASTDEAYAQR